MPGITARLNDQGMKEFHIAETEKSLFCFFSKGAGDFPLLILQASTLESSLSFLKRAQHIYFIAFYWRIFALLLDLLLMLVVLVK